MSDPKEIVRLHHRTWELELLISGAIVVALFQVPQWLDAGFDELSERVSRELWVVVWNVYYPMKMAIMPAVTVFVVHILLRGMWVGLVGLNSVYPDGVKWDKVNMGPVSKDFATQRVDPLKLQHRIDHIASLLFAILFSLMFFALALGLWISAAMVFVIILKSIGLVDMPIDKLAYTAYFTVLGIILVPAILMGFLDQAMGKWPSLEKKRFLRTLVQGGFRVFFEAMFGRLWYPMVMTLQSNMVKEKPEFWRTIAVALPIGFLLPLAVLGPVLGGRLINEVDSYVWAPDRPMQQGMMSAHYLSLDPDGIQKVPAIQSDVVSGPYLRLYLPYDSRHDNRRIQELCPDHKPLRVDGDIRAALKQKETTEEERRQALDCMTQIWTIELDGQPLKPDYLFGDHGKGRGLVAYIPITELAMGRHDLGIERYETVEKKEEPDYNPQSNQFFIPFWK